MKRTIQILATLLISTALSGCVVPCTVPTASKTPAAFGDIQIFGTYTPPFEYEEIGVHSLMIDTPNQQVALKAYADQVREMGADAVLGFRIKPLTIGWNIFGLTVALDNTQYELEGVAVKIKRP